MTTRVLIACVTEKDSAQLAQCIAAQSRGEMECAVASIANVRSMAAAIKPHVALLAKADFEMLLEIARASPATRCLLLGDGYTPEQTVEAVRFGAAGCVQRTSPPEMLAKAVTVANGGGAWFGRSDLLNALRAQLRLPDASGSQQARLTTREEEILRLTGSGLSNKEIARRLAISDLTVKTHLHRVYSKLHQSGRVKAFLSQPPAP